MATASTRLTAVVPCYNAERYLADALNSVFAQSLRPTQVIVVDDCSTDASLSIARKYPVEILRTVHNVGPAAAMNLGAQHAKNDWLAWLAADDTWDHNHCQTVSQLLDQHSDACVAFSAVRFGGNKSGTWGPRLPAGVAVEAFWDCLRETVVPGITAIVRRDAHHAIGGFDEQIRFASDFDFWLRLAQHGRFVCTHAVTATYRWHEQQISQKPRRQWHSVYLTRYRLWRNALDVGDKEFAARIETVMHDAWEHDLGWAWDQHAMADLRYLLSMRMLMPPAHRILWLWVLRGMAPTPMRSAWSLIPQRTRARLVPGWLARRTPASDGHHLDGRQKIFRSQTS